MPKIFKSLSQNKKTLFLIIGVGLFLSLTPSHFAHAFIWDDILNAINYVITIPFRVGVFVLMLFIVAQGLVTSLVYLVIVMITNWITHVSVMVGITPDNPATPGIVKIGWDFTRDFANMFFIIVLVFIGLATILKIREYEAKKALPRLILIALLINFTPVIVGFIVDMGNIVTNFLIMQGDVTPLEVVGNIWTQLLTSLGEVWGETGDILTIFAKFIGIIVYGIVVIVFFLLASWVYFWVMLVFLLRIVMLWILMILAPIAFLSYIFPASRNIKKFFPSILHWDAWWEEFLQWVLVGIPLGFFLYLSNWIMATANQSDLSTKLSIGTFPAAPPDGWPSGPIGGPLETAFVGLIVELLAPTVGLVLLYKGYKIAKETAPAAARGIIEGVKKIGTLAAAAGITAVTMGAGAGLAAKALGGASAGARRLETFTGKAGFSVRGRRIEPFKYLVGKPISGVTQGMEKAIAPSLLTYAAKARRVEIPPEFDKMSATEHEQYIRSQVSARNRVQLAAKAVDLKTFDKTGEEFQKKIAKEAEGLTEGRLTKGLYNKEVGKIMNALPNEVTAKIMVNLKGGEKAKADMKEEINDLAKEISVDVKFAKLKSKIKKRAKETGIKEEQLTRDTAAKMIHIGEIKPNDVPKIASKDFWTSLGTMEGIQRSWGGARLRRAGDEFGPKFVGDYMEEANRKRADWFIENNQKALLYLSGNAAQDLGFSSPEGFSREEVREMVRWYKEESGRRRKPRPPYEI